MTYYLYILHSEKFDRYYIGQTQDLRSRLNRHNNGEVLSTKAYRPWDIVHTEKYPDRSQAMRRERLLKSWKSKVKIKELVAQP